MADPLVIAGMCFVFLSSQGWGHVGVQMGQWEKLWALWALQQPTYAGKTLALL